MPGERFEFEGHSGHRLAARLDRPAGRPRGAALFAHCFTCSKDIAAARLISQGLAARGFATLRFDFTGLGQSDGEFANTGFISNVEDLRLAAAAMATRGMAPDILVGHSLGGAAAIAAAEGVPSAKAVATIGAPFDPAHVTGHFGESLDEIRETGEAEVTIAGRGFRVTRDFLDDVREAKLGPALAHLRKALLVMHAPRDEVVGVDAATAIFVAARHPKSFVSLDDADHLLSDPKDADYAAEVIAAWAARYVPAPEAGQDGPPEGVVRVQEASPDAFLQDIEIAGGVALRADEPPSVGGSGLGATPYQLVAAGLGACTSMTLRMYAKRKGLPLDSVRVDVSHDRIHAEDCAECETKDGRIDRFRREILIEGDLDAEQRARLLEIADRCPVHRTLEGEIHIETEEAGE